MLKRAATVTAVAAVVVTPGFAAAASSKAPTYPYAQATGLVGSSGDFEGSSSPTETSPKSTGESVEPKTPHDSDQTTNDSSKGERFDAWTSHGNAASAAAADKEGDGPDGHKSALYSVEAKRNKDLTVDSKVTGDFSIDSDKDANTKTWLAYLGDVKNRADCNSGKDVHGTTTASGLWIKQQSGDKIKKVALPAGNKEKTYKDVAAGQNEETEYGGKYYPQYTNSATDLRLRRLTTADLANFQTDGKKFKNQGVDAVGGWMATIDEYGVDAQGKRGDKIGEHVVTLAQVLCTMPKDFKPRKVEKIPTKIPAGPTQARSDDAGPLIAAGSMVGLVGAGYLARRRRATQG